MAGIDFIDPEGYWLDPDGNVRRLGTTEEDGEQAIIAKLTEVCTDAERMLLADALDKAARTTVARSTAIIVSSRFSSRRKEGRNGRFILSRIF
jgi:hypothetical protein